MQRRFDDVSLSGLAQVAAAFLAEAGSGSIVELHGEMGAGKTTFVAECGRCLGVEEVSSPTFAIVNEYHLPERGRMFHFDLYRLNSAAELADIGFEEYLDQGALVFIEWPEVAAPWLQNRPRFVVRITLTDTGRQLVWEQK